MRKKKMVKEIVKAIYEAKKLVVRIKVIERDLLELYYTFYFIVHMGTYGR